MFTIFQYYEEWFNSENFNGCLFSRALFEAGNTNNHIKSLNAQFRTEMLKVFRRILSETLKPEAAERTSLMILMLIDGAIIAQGSNRDTPANKEYPPVLVAWQAAKNIIYAEGGQLD
ncbi:hypothetical protein [Vibrio salinus]|uniref:hypothetical protein n=1 Tax=Vibrio salinus TaxID=2899784 RepID=UPI001E4F6B8A|nr:hypothetical protein [Vibrio salinus]MCE0492392.1 hypothetical protein [Vibrio salinus]